MLRVIYEPAEPEYDAWREDKGSFIPDNADSVCFYAGQECDFESWCQNYKRQNKIKLSALSQETMQDAQRALDEIDEKIKLNGIEELIKINRLQKDASQSILDLLFNKHAIYAFKGSLVLMKQDYLGNLRKLKKEIKSFLGEPKIKETEIASSGNNKKITPIFLPPGAKWEEIVIKFFGEEKIKIKYKDKTINSDYKKMGFEDTRKGKPNKQWEFLCLLALRNGEFAWGDSPRSKSRNIRKTEQEFGYEMDDSTSEPAQNRGFSIIKAPDNIKKTKQLLSRGLKDVFQIDSPPFYSYKKERMYKTRFVLNSGYTTKIHPKIAQIRK